MLGMKNHFDISDSIEIREVDIAGVTYTCTYNGKSGNWHLFLCYCRYFDKSSTEMFLE